MDTKEKEITDMQAYDILDMPGCPIKLPHARSMTQARNDLQNIKHLLIKWHTTYINQQKQSV